MMLNEAQRYLLNQIRIGNGLKLRFEDFFDYLEETESKLRWQELGSFVIELDNADLLRIQPGTFTTGGSEHPVYKNRVVLIWFDRILLSQKGQHLVDNEMF